MIRNWNVNIKHWQQCKYQHISKRSRRPAISINGTLLQLRPAKFALHRTASYSTICLLINPRFNHPLRSHRPNTPAVVISAPQCTTSALSLSDAASGTQRPPIPYSVHRPLVSQSGGSVAYCSAARRQMWRYVASATRLGKVSDGGGCFNSHLSA